MGWFTKRRKTAEQQTAATAHKTPEVRQLWLEHDDDEPSPRRCVAITQAGEPCKNTPHIGYVACSRHGGRTLPPLRSVK